MCFARMQEREDEVVEILERSTPVPGQDKYHLSAPGESFPELPELPSCTYGLSKHQVRSRCWARQVSLIV